MKTITPAEIKYNKASYVDPQGFVFDYEGDIYRAIRPASEAFVKSLLQRDVVNGLLSGGSLVETSISPLTVSGLSSLVLQHERIWPVSYCNEWAPQMLKDAALLTLNFEEKLIDEGLTLQDAYPWNILFKGSQPVLVDFTSIAEYRGPRIWNAHQQFVSNFLLPLELYQGGNDKVVRLLLTDSINGISLHDYHLAQTFGFRCRHPLKALNRSLALWVENFVKRRENLQVKLSEQTSNYFSKHVPEPRLRKRFVQKQIRAVEKIDVGRQSSTWASYYDEVTRKESGSTKRQAIDSFLKEKQPRTVLDLGCNVGVYSKIAAENGARVISLDADTQCVQALYNDAVRNKLAISPYVVDLNNPAQSYGFSENQFESIFGRFASDSVFCLGLMHHLHISGRQSFERITEFLAKLAQKFLVFEFISIEDGNISRIDHGRKINYSEEEVVSALEDRFVIEQRLESDRQTRKLFICKAR